MTQAFSGDGASQPLLWSALVPVAAGGWFTTRQIVRAEFTEVSLNQSVRDLRSALAVLFALLLFFQFANEWLIAGWLPVFLIDRMGMSPASAINLLGIYWTALTIGRIGATKLLPLVRHGRMLALSAFFALFGCSLIAFGSSTGVVLGILLTGAGFSAIYPLAAERIAGRFSYYHPGYFNGIFTFALMGGILAPFVAGHIAMGSGLGSIPVAAMAGSCAVLALVLLIWLGHRVSGH
jgi:fucose permease